jgi:type IV pilus assembly protein PilA
VSEGAVLTDGAKTAVAEFYSNTGSLANAKNASIGLATAASIKGKYVTQVLVDDGLITATFGNEANTAITDSSKNTFVLSPVTNAGSISWTCTGSTVEAKYLPTSCR